MDQTNFFSIIDTAQIVIKYIRCQNYRDASLNIAILSDHLRTSDAIRSECLNPESTFWPIINSMSESMNNNDMVLYADILEESLIPYIKTLIVPNDTIELDNYSIEPTSSGTQTLFFKPGSFYLHSNCNPMDEARCLADAYYDENFTEYAVFGLGLGYHVKALSELSLESLKINVYEPDSALIEHVRENDFFNLFNNKLINIIEDPSCDKFSKHIAEKKCGILFHYPSIMKITDISRQIALKKFYRGLNSYSQWKRTLKINFNNNVINCTEKIIDIKKDFCDKTVIVVAAGPSLDNSLEKIKKLKNNNSTIICVTTVLKKLLETGIEPNYTVVMDANHRTYKHIEGIENCQVPMIIDSTAYWKFAANYGGKKYLALQYGYEPAKSLASSDNLPMFNTGWSVTTLAIDIVLQFGAKELYLAGVDMAYPSGRTHAQGTIDENDIEKENLIKIKDVNGDTVYTSEQLYSYLTWIENRLNQSPEVKVYNLSDCGAMIKGTNYIHE